MNLQRFVAVVVVAVTAVPIPWAAESSRAPNAVDAFIAIIDVERTLLGEDMVRHQRLAQQRALTFNRLQELYVALDAAIQRKDAATMETLVFQVEATERERAEQVGFERLVVERIRDRLRRIVVLEERLEGLDVTVETAVGPLEGRWDVSMLPISMKGVFNLKQEGTIVSGTYRLEGGWTGSLTGTLVERKVHLVRIDSKLGRSMEFEGFLASDGDTIRGTWQSYDLSTDLQPSGQWSAVRRDSD
jgi:hypothetical protein